jgi:leader peptidase (prepilin peptidase)/N-methyltransferase
LAPNKMELIGAAGSFLVGLCLGSFANVLITRLPQEDPLFTRWSHCQHCRNNLSWQDKIPLISYGLLKARCRFCGWPIPWRYPLVEFLGGILALALWLKFPGSLDLLVYGPLVFLLLVLAFLDLECWWLPDILTYPGIVLGLILAPTFSHLTIFEAAAGAFLGWLFLESIRWGYKWLTGRDGMGGGDAKLMALIGSFLGIAALPWVCLISAGLGLIAGAIVALKNRSGRLTPMPYGPFLILAAIVVIFQGNYYF